MSVILLSGRRFTNQGISDAGENVVGTVDLTGTGTASGGTEEDLGPYRVHTFTSSGSLTITNASANGMDLEYLLVAGGGGSNTQATYYAGGGGGGVLIWHNGRSIDDVNTGPAFRVYNGDVITVTIGGGGTAGSLTAATNGGNTSITVSGTNQTVITQGGGAGANRYIGLARLGSPGGSAGGNGAGNTVVVYGMSIGWPRQGTDGNVRMGGSAWKKPSLEDWGLPKPRSNNDNIWPGVGLRVAFNSSVTEYGTGSKVTRPANQGYGGFGRASTSYSGSSGVAILRYLTNNTVAVTGAELLVVAGGAGGAPGGAAYGSGYWGPGGAGGLVYYGSETAKTADGPALTLYAGTYQVIVGAGGSGSAVGATAPTEPLSGNHSAFMHPAGIQHAVAFKGVGRNPEGGASNPEVHLAGLGPAYGEDFYGSTSSQMSTSTSFSRYTLPYPNQGNYGGSYITSFTYSGPGAGGAGSVGSDSTGSTTTDCVGGNGGNGLQYSISGTATYYAGGGGGYCYRSAFVGQGGLGGGGKGGYNGEGKTSAHNGSPNTGGGGGSWYVVTSATTANTSGGSGIVILRYPDTYAAATSTTGSPTYTNTGGWHIYQFTASGSITFA